MINYIYSKGWYNEYKTDILNYYMHELTSEELANFDNLTEENIRLIVNRIWHNFLSSDFKLGESFKFLGTFLSPIELIEDDNIMGRNEGYIRLISSEDLSFTADEMDLITDIDWTKTKNYIYQYTSKEKVSILKVDLILKLSW